MISAMKMIPPTIKAVTIIFCLRAISGSTAGSGGVEGMLPGSWAGGIRGAVFSGCSTIKIL
jgi:hypothetical protein